MIWIKLLLLLEIFIKVSQFYKSNWHIILLNKFQSQATTDIVGNVVKTIRNAKSQKTGFIQVIFYMTKKILNFFSAEYFALWK